MADALPQLTEQPPCARTVQAVAHAVLRTQKVSVPTVRWSLEIVAKQFQS